MAGCGGSTQEKQITGLNAVTTDAQVSTSACSASEEQKGSDAQGAMAACIMEINQNIAELQENGSLHHVCH